MGATLLTSAACGGGGGGGGGGGTPPTAVPTVAPTNASYRPAASGDQFAYTGTLAQQFVRIPLGAVPTPSPNPASSMTLQYAVSQQVAVSAT
ncbi:MAG TPA: hypothetical protein VGD50_03290, partial [Candidatus Baltobacteraceae bacterium]